MECKVHRKRKKYKSWPWLSYRADNIVMVISFGWLCDVFSWSRFLSLKNPGSFGRGNSMSLPSIITTADILGLSSGHRCTHNRPIWIDRNASRELHEFSTNLSSNRMDLPSLNSIQAWPHWDQPLGAILAFRRWTVLWTHMSKKIMIMVWMLKPSVSQPAYNLKHQYTIAKDIRFCWENSIESVFWRHVTTTEIDVLKPSV